jgi:hypothetical protein
MPASSVADAVKSSRYPFWADSSDLKGERMSLYWSKDVEISAVVTGKAGLFTINCADAKGVAWTVAVANVPTMAEAQRIAEVILKFIELEK